LDEMRGSSDGAPPQQQQQQSQQQKQPASDAQAPPQTEASNGEATSSVPLQVTRSSPGSPGSGRDSVWPVSTAADSARD
jgi:hypothetical protein